MPERKRQPDSLFRTAPTTSRQGRHTFRSGSHEQRPETLPADRQGSDSLANSGRPVNGPVRRGPYRDFELVWQGRAA